MEEIKRLYAGSLAVTEKTLYNNANGAIVKTIALNNTNLSDTEVTLSIDGVTFLIPLEAKETKILSSVMVVNDLKASGDGVNIHVSGIQLGGA